MCSFQHPIFELSWFLRSMCVAAPTSSLWSKQALLLYGTQEDDCTLLFFFSSGASQPRSLLTGLRIEAAQPQEAKESMQEASSLQQLSYQGLLPYGFWRGKFKYILYSLWQLLLLLLHLRYFCSSWKLWKIKEKGCHRIYILDLAWRKLSLL